MSLDETCFLEIQEVDHGCRLSVKVSAGARKNEIRGQHAGALKVAVRQVAERGKANKAVIQLLADRLAIAKSNITIVAGHTSSLKKLEFANLSAKLLKSRLVQK